MAQETGFVTEIAHLFPRQGAWTEDDYFALPDASQVIELAYGELLMAPPPVPQHQRIIRRLSFDLSAFVEHGQIGEVMFAPIAVRLAPGLIREPDVLMIRAEHADRVTDKGIKGIPDWVAEVISPGSRVTDEVTKLKEYADAGIPEYWLLDMQSKTIRVNVLRGGSSYALAATYGSGQKARSETIVGFETSVDNLFAG